MKSYRPVLTEFGVINALNRFFPSNIPKYPLETFIHSLGDHPGLIGGLNIST